jgi:hypothetical protein
MQYSMRCADTADSTIILALFVEKDLILWSGHSCDLLDMNVRPNTDDYLVR